MPKKRNSTIWQNLDWLTIGLYLLLVALGWFNIYSAVYADDQVDTFSFATRYGKQLIWVAASLLIMVTALVIDSKFYASFAMVIYAAIIVLLLFVLGFGERINGAKSWLVLGPIRIQPAEFAKMATAMALAKYLSRYNLKPKKFSTFVRFAFIAFLPMLLVLAQNDTGSALVFMIFLLVYYREGMPSIYLVVGFLAVALFILSMLYPNYIIVILIEIFGFVALYIFNRRLKPVYKALLPLVLLSVAFWFGFKYFLPGWSPSYPVLLALVIMSVYYAINVYKAKIQRGYFILIVMFSSILFTYSVDYVFENVLIEHQQSRIKDLLGIESDPYGAGYNVRQSMIAIGSGGPTGKGYLQGTQTKFRFVPEQSTDFIFCTVGEEWGFIGTTTVLLLFLFLLLRLVYLAERQKSPFSRIYGYGVACIFFFHIAVNVGMTIKLFPVIGIPLPFFSYGGSSLWAFTLLLFIFLKLDANREQLIN